jgi:S1-C subfamily serine protease/retron-type reverse transcriptase
MTETPLPEITKDQFLSIATAQELAAFLGLSYSQLARVIYNLPDKYKYKEFTINKRSGGERSILSPCFSLKNIQKKLSKILYGVYRQKSPAHGFCKRRNVVTNASQHLSKKYVFNIDLSDFFGCIHFGRVRNMFMKKPYELPYEVSTVLANICCHKNTLPQGAPTSPIISNMITRKLDNNLSRLAQKNNSTYTRYADDISFSFTCSYKKLPRAIVYEKGGETFPGHELVQIIHSNGFNINESKVRLCKHGQRKEVTGLTVNEFPNVKRSFVRQISSMLYAWDKHGPEATQKYFIEKYQSSHRQRASDVDPRFENVLKGKINYLKMVRGAKDPIYRKLAYRYSVLAGTPKEYLNQEPHEVIYNSLFIVDNHVDICQGTAFLLEGYGLITSNHVVKSLSENTDIEGLIDVYQYHDLDKKYPVRIVKKSAKNDLALLVFEKQDGQDELPKFKYLKPGDCTGLKTGVKLSVFGFPKYAPGNHPYVAQCFITYKSKFLDLVLFNVTVPIADGNSGGPILNENDQVVGIATAGSETMEEGYKTTSHGFLPINIVSCLDA